MRGRGHDPAGVRAAGRAADVPPDGGRHRGSRRGPARAGPGPTRLRRRARSTRCSMPPTVAAVEQMYADAGYAAEGPSEEQRTELTTAREAVTSAERSVVDARRRSPTPRSRCRSRSDSSWSSRSTPPARRCPQPRRRPSRHASSRTSWSPTPVPPATRPARFATRRRRPRRRARARTPSIPTPSEPYTPERIAALDVAAAEAQETYTEAEAQLVIAEQARDSAIAPPTPRSRRRGAAAGSPRRSSSEGTAAADNGPLQEAITTAETGLVDGADRPGRARGVGRHCGSRQGRSCSRPCCRRTLTEAYVALGSAVDGPVGHVGDDRHPRAGARGARRRRGGGGRQPRSRSRSATPGSP